jgi:hypothetical protein
MTLGRFCAFDLVSLNRDRRSPHVIYVDPLELVGQSYTVFAVDLTSRDCSEARNNEALDGSSYIAFKCVPVCSGPPPEHAYRCGNVRPISACCPSFRLIITTCCTLSLSLPFFSCRMPHGLSLQEEKRLSSEPGWVRFYGRRDHVTASMTTTSDSALVKDYEPSAVNGHEDGLRNPQSESTRTQKNGQEGITACTVPP